MTASDRAREREQKDVRRLKTKIQGLAKRVNQVYESEWETMDAAIAKELAAIADKLNELAR